MKKYILLLAVVVFANNFIFAQCSGGSDYICGNENPTTGVTNYYTVVNVPNATSYRWTMYDYSNEDPSDRFDNIFTPTPTIDINFSVPSSYFLICEAYNANGYIRSFYDILIVPVHSSLRANDFKISSGVEFLQISSNSVQPHLWDNADTNVNLK